MTVIATAIAGDTTMAEPEVYLEKLSAFSRMLRLEGLPVSPKETADAARILTFLGFAISIAFSVFRIFFGGLIYSSQGAYTAFALASSIL